MTEMVERVEDAIVEELLRQKIAARSWGNSFDSLNPPVRWDDVARAALKATREPTEAMTNAAVDTDAMRDVNNAISVAAVHGIALPDKYHLPDTPLVIWWRAMIDAAIKA